MRSDGGTRAARGRPTPARPDRARYAAALDMAGDAGEAHRCLESLRGSATPSAARAAISAQSRDRAPSAAAPVAWRHPAAQPVDRAEIRDVLVERTSGATESGVLAAQTPTSITLRQGSAQPITIPRAEIRKITAVVDARRSRQARDAGGDGRFAGVSAQVAMASRRTFRLKAKPQCNQACGCQSPCGQLTPGRLSGTVALPAK